jgi:tetratricopeptide (TPR) repeat protein
MTLCVHTGRAIASGRLADAERLAVETAEIGRIGGQREVLWAFGMHRFLIGTERGSVDVEISDLLKRLADDFRAAGGSLNVLDVAAALAAVQVGRTAEAQAWLDHLMGRSPTLDYFTVLSEALLSQLVVRLGKRDEAAEVYQRLRPYPEWVVPFHNFPVPAVSFHLGLLAAFLGRFDEAEEHFTEAATDHERIGAPTYLARTRLEWARMLLARRRAGDERRADTLLTEASAAARELGLFGVEREAAALLGR